MKSSRSGTFVRESVKLAYKFPVGNIVSPAPDKVPEREQILQNILESPKCSRSGTRALRRHLPPQVLHRRLHAAAAVRDGEGL